MDLGTYDPDEQAREFHRDAQARALAMVVAYRQQDADVLGWKVLTDDLMPSLPPVGSPFRASWEERNRRLTATLLALASLGSRLVDAAFADPDAWSEDQADAISRGLDDDL